MIFNYFCELCILNSLCFMFRHMCLNSFVTIVACVGDCFNRFLDHLWSFWILPSGRPSYLHYLGDISNWNSCLLQYFHLPLFNYCKFTFFSMTLSSTWLVLISSYLFLLRLCWMCSINSGWSMKLIFKLQSNFL